MASRKAILSIVIFSGLIVFATGNVYGQFVIDKSISAALQSDLPVTSDRYGPCCSWFSYTFEFDIEVETNLNNATYIQLDVIQSNLDRYVCSAAFHIGNNYQVTGEAYTGNGNDYLKLSKWLGGTSGVFSNMDFRVHYFNKSEG